MARAEKIIGKDALERLYTMGLRTIEKSLYLVLKDAEYEERKRK